MQLPAQCETEIVSLQDKFLSDFESIMLEQSLPNPKRRIIMLSAGTESLYLLAAAHHLWPATELHTIKIRGTSTEDSRGADMVAAHIGTTHHSTYELTVKGSFDPQGFPG